MIRKALSYNRGIVLAALKALVRRIRGLPPSAESPAERNERLLNNVREHLRNSPQWQGVDYSTLREVPIEEVPQNVLDEIERQFQHLPPQERQQIRQPPVIAYAFAEPSRPEPNRIQRLIEEGWEFCSTRKLWLLATGSCRLAGNQDRIIENELWADEHQESINNSAEYKDYAYRMAVQYGNIPSLHHFVLALFPCVIGVDPFIPVDFDPNWRTSDVVAIARGMYEKRDFSPMPLLADALQDAGCDDESILNHCRSNNAAILNLCPATGPHVRGCWVVDLILNKK